MNIVFLHGLESGPHGSKYQALKKQFGDILSPDCSGIFDEQERLKIICAQLENDPGPFLVVGSSMGGLMALLLQQAQADKVAGLVLCAPAIHRPAAEGLDFGQLPPTTVIHGTKDDVVPFEVSKVFGDRLIAVDDDHRLGQSMAVILHAVKKLKNNIKQKGRTN